MSLFSRKRSSRLQEDDSQFNQIYEQESDLDYQTGETQLEENFYYGEEDDQDLPSDITYGTEDFWPQDFDDQMIESLDSENQVIYEAPDQQEAYQDYPEEAIGRRAKYSAKLDKFLNNGIIIVGILLLMVLLIAFLV